MELTRGQRLVARLWVGDRGNHPVFLADDPDQEPSLRGNRYYWTTPSGKTIVRHPHAYGWPVEYHHSTRHVSVGWRWLLRHPISMVTRDGVRMWALSSAIAYVHGFRCTPGWVRGERCTLVEGKERSYHANGWDVRAAIRRALAAWRQQREADQRKAALTAALQRVWVTREDSLGSGNCEIGTDTVAQRLAHDLGAGEYPIGAVRADYLLQYRDDPFTRRAVQHAAHRLGII